MTIGTWGTSPPNPLGFIALWRLPKGEGSDHPEVIATLSVDALDSALRLRPRRALSSGQAFVSYLVAITAVNLTPPVVGGALDGLHEPSPASGLGPQILPVPYPLAWCVASRNPARCEVALRCNARRTAGRRGEQGDRNGQHEDREVACRRQIPGRLESR